MIIEVNRGKEGWRKESRFCAEPKNRIIKTGLGGNEPTTGRGSAHEDLTWRGAAGRQKDSRPEKGLKGRRPLLMTVRKGRKRDCRGWFRTI